MLGNGFCFFDVFVCRVFPRRMAAHMFFHLFFWTIIFATQLFVVLWAGCLFFVWFQAFLTFLIQDVFSCFFVESLILAQDERWRRA